jgi:hypothetical protein
MARITYKIIGGFNIGMEKQKLFRLVNICRFNGWYIALVLPRRKLLPLRKFSDRERERRNDDEYMSFI